MNSQATRLMDATGVNIETMSTNDAVVGRNNGKIRKDNSSPTILLLII